MWLIVGLGNPGPRYELTRHNFGFLAIDALLDDLGQRDVKSGFGGITCRFDLDGHSCLALKPQTFMNRSGSSVQQAMAFHKISIDNVLVIHDDLDLPLGAIRIKQGGGLGGHNGLKDIDRLVGPEFLRLRLGIGRPNFKGTEADYVLHPFRNEEFKRLGDILPTAVKAIRNVITEGMDQAKSALGERVLKS